MALARQFSTLANAVAAHYGVKLSAAAHAYDQQEEASAAALGASGGLLAGGAGSALDVLNGAPGLGGLSGGAPVSGAAAGEVPSSPRDIARLIETGRSGTGKQAWQDAERSLEHEAGRLDDAADQLGAAINQAEGGWHSSTSADPALAKMRELRTWYGKHADYVRGLAGEARTHVGNFSQAVNTIPSYKDVVKAESELKNATAANARSGGLYRAAVVHAQVKVSGLYSASTAGFTSYGAAEALSTPTMPTPPPGLTSSPPATDAGSKQAGDSKVETLKPTPSPSSAPVTPVQAGNGVGQEGSPGSTFPVGALDPAATADPLVDALPDTDGSALPEMVPSLISGMVGGLGGALGGLAGAGSKAVQGLQQAASPLMNEMGQHKPDGGGDKPQDGEKSGGSEPSSEPPGGSELAGASDGGGGGGGGGGEMEPAGGPEPMAAPPDVAPTPVAAAPAAAPAPAPEPAAGGTGMGMMPPMGGAPGGGGQGPDVKGLQRERKLTMIAPPNSEPVKNRREGRDRKKARDE